MKVEFQVDVKEKDLLDFKIYHNYHSASGILTFMFGLISLAIGLVLAIGYTAQANLAYVLLALFFGLYFTVYTPLGMYLSVKKQMKKVKAFAQPVKYVFMDDKIILSQADIIEELMWDDIYKVKSTGRSIILYLTAVRANVIPLRAIEGCEQEFVEMVRAKLKPFQVKLNDNKILNR